MSVGTATVYIVDDDPDVRESMAMMIQSMGLEAEPYPSAEAFLDGCGDATDSPKCMVLDVRLPGLSGLGLQQMLAAEGKGMPTIMISGCADIPTAITAMRAGAVDFLEKPISSRTLAVRIREAIDASVCQQREVNRKNGLSRQVDGLSTRQREVFDLLLAGERSKQIARRLGIGEKTVAKHRAGVLEKMQVESVVELICMFADANPAHTMEHVPVAHCI